MPELHDPWQFDAADRMVRDYRGQPVAQLMVEPCEVTAVGRLIASAPAAVSPRVPKAEPEYVPTIQFSTRQERLTEVLRSMARAMRGVNVPHKIFPNEASDVGECLLALARILEGKSVGEAFGSPGSFGYSNPIGAALAVAYRTPLYRASLPGSTPPLPFASDST